MRIPRFTRNIFWAGVAIVILTGCTIQMPEDFLIKKDNDPETGGWQVMIGTRTRNEKLIEYQPEPENGGDQLPGKPVEPTVETSADCMDKGDVSWARGSTSHEFSGTATGCLEFSIRVLDNHKFNLPRTENADARLWNPGGHEIEDRQLIRHGGVHVLRITPHSPEDNYVVVVEFIPVEQDNGV